MTSKEFVIWLKGFATASNNYSITPKQWDDLKDKLGEVNDDSLPTLQIFPYTQVKGINYTSTFTSEIKDKELLKD
jgi:hypothetical protein